jgi:fructooligosaccharide transport system substrate-binding protein
MKHKSRLFVFFNLLMAVLMLVGCAAQPTPAAAPTAAPVVPATAVPVVVVPPTAEPVKPADTAAPAAAAPVKVQYWSDGWFAESINARKAMVDKFNKEYQGKIEVEYVQGDWDSADQYIQNGVAAGGGISCLMETYDAGAVGWYQKGYVNDLRPYITPEIKAYMSDAAWAARTNADDGAVAMSGTVAGDLMLTLMYNPQYFKDAGIEPATVDKPWNWDTLFENAKKLTVDVNGKHLGEAGFDKNNVAHWGYVERLDSEKVLENGLNFAQMPMGVPIIRQDNGKWGWYLNDKGAKAYERYLTPIQAGITPEAAIGLGGDTIEQMFAEGKAAIILRETFAIPTLHMNFPDFKFAAMPIPMDTGDKMFYNAGGEGMVITKTCDQPKAAAEFMFWLMKPENAAAYAYGNGMPPANFDGLNYEPFKSDPTWDIVRNYLKIGINYTVPYNAHMAEFRDTVVAPTLMDVAAGKTSFADAMKLIQDQADKLLNQ